ncbi:MAG: hypothetical protein ACKOB9_07960, partial [Solirubrobacterales bacterium]
VAVYRNPGGLTPANKAQIASDRRELDSLGLARTGPFAPPVYSKNGQERGRLVVLHLLELGRKLGGAEADHREQPDGDDDPAAAPAGYCLEESLHGRRTIRSNAAGPLSAR